MFLHILQAKAMTTFVPGYLFKNVYIENSLERQRWCFTEEHRAGLFAVQHNKDNMFPE